MISMELFQDELVLKKYDKNDAAERWKAISDSKEALSTWFNWCHPDYSEEENRKMVEECDCQWESGLEFSFRIIDKQTERQVGECRINHINQTHLFGNISYWVRSGYEGRGIATRAVALIAKFAFRELKLNRLEIFVSPRNKASQIVAQKAGAIKEGILRNRISLRGEIEDAVMYSLIPDDIN